ncbi:unnamed protein product [Owenia fusiformis]|uniref:Uncharacterized protein n=1 Tax=Owenia fusiformis TaxID=6347 RepID=A0A8S4P6Z5_OWEFU|nr:unnamed protein product [Owenia fusiformis]
MYPRQEGAPIGGAPSLRNQPLTLHVQDGAPQHVGLQSLSTLERQHRAKIRCSVQLVFAGVFLLIGGIGLTFFHAIVLSGEEEEGADVEEEGSGFGEEVDIFSAFQIIGPFLIGIGLIMSLIGIFLYNKAKRESVITAERQREQSDTSNMDSQSAPPTLSNQGWRPGLQPLNAPPSISGTTYATPPHPGTTFPGPPHAGITFPGPPHSGPPPPGTTFAEPTLQSTQIPANLASPGPPLPPGPPPPPYVPPPPYSSELRGQGVEYRGISGAGQSAFKT